MFEIRIKYEEIDDIDELRICLRQEAARWACLLDDITCTKEANNKLEQHLQDLEKHKLLPWWKEWTYCKGLMINTNKPTWESVHVHLTAVLIIIINNVYSVNLLTEEINEHVKWLKAYAKILFDEIKEMDSIMLNSDKAENKISIRKYQIERQKEYYSRFFL
ncbi:uncharacterized protein LOC114944941 [Nylanderia fulva]|uniref:uncharacterized protein LOC114944938 n=1 Tax=Nylanderia fulva TaxID=613905 RepID=UPI0010FB98CF|nr:uncharacterized protein LOC114944938 [Nylanderia fulva]XP_029176833.1 uncharacterized protein LOC114944941 [Nylanderia fulva]